MLGAPSLRQTPKACQRFDGFKGICQAFKKFPCVSSKVEAWTITKVWSNGETTEINMDNELGTGLIMEVYRDCY